MSFCIFAFSWVALQLCGVFAQFLDVEMYVFIVMSLFDWSDYVILNVSFMVSRWRVLLELEKPYVFIWGCNIVYFPLLFLFHLSKL